VVTLVVRAIAKRHFQARLSPRPIQPLPLSVQPSPWRRLLLLLGLVRSKPAKPHRRRKATRADGLYRALREFLLYEWQVPLIPHYAPLPVPLVRTLGPRILEYRDPEQLQELATNGAAMLEQVSPETGMDRPQSTPASVPPTTATPRPQKPSDVPRPTPAARRKAELMWSHSQKMKLSDVFGIDTGEMRRTIAHISGISSLAMAAIGASGLTAAEAVVVLCTIDRAIGHANMRERLGENATPTFLRALVQQIKAEHIPGMGNPGKIRPAMESVLKRMRAQGHLP
jgi:hypothetical protein